MRKLRRQNRTLMEELEEKKSAKTRAKDFSAYLGPKKKKNLKLTGASVEKTSSKVVAQPVAEVVANYQQSGSKVVAKSGSDTIKNIKTSSKVVAQPVAEVVANYQQSGSKVVAKSGFQELSGIQRKLLEVIYLSCRKNGGKTSSPITISYLSNLLETTTGTVKNAIHRLQKKEFITKAKFKNGRGGWTQYQLDNDAYQELLFHESDSKVVANYQQTSSKVVAQPVAQPVATAPSSSSYLNNITTTTSDDELWKTLDLSVVEKLGINSPAVLEARSKFGPFSFVDFEKLIIRFATYMNDSSKSSNISNARGFFFSLCKQMKEGLEPLSEIKTDEDLALEKLLTEKKLAKKNREQLHKELMEFEFEDWLEKLSEAEKAQIQPESDLLRAGTEPYKAILRSYFEKNLWEQIKNKAVK